MAANLETTETVAKAAALLGGAATGVGIANLLKKPAPQVSGQFPPEVLDLLRTIADGMQATLADLQQIYDAINSLSFNVQGYAPNADYPLSGRLPLQVALTAVQIPQLFVPDDFSIAIKSWPGNPAPPAGLLYVARSKADAENVEASWPLVQNEAYPYRLKSTDNLWVSATVVPAWVCWTVEQRR